MNFGFGEFSTDSSRDILKRKLKTSNFTVIAFKFEPLGEQKGFFGDHFILKINYTEDGTERNIQFFAKAMSSTESQKAFMEEGGLFSKECRFFEVLVPKMLDSGVALIADCVPSCYLVSDAHYLIFEDLGLRGYTTLNPRTCLSLNSVKSALNAMAKLHCSGLVLEEVMKEKTGRDFTLSEEYPDIFKESFFPFTESSRRFLSATKKGAEAQIDLFYGDSKNVDLFKSLTFDLFDNFREIVKPSSTFRNTICHGDLWASNFMYNFENGKPSHCYIVDYQMLRYGPPGQDFMVFLYLTTNREFREKHKENLMEYYYEEMARILEEYRVCLRKLIGFDEFVASCEYYRTFAAAIALNHGHLIMVPPEETKHLFEEPGGIERVMFEDKSEIVYEFCEKNTAYRKKMHETITDLRDAFMANKKLLVEV